MVAKAAPAATTQQITVRLHLWIDAALICLALGFGFLIPIGSHFAPFGFRYSIPTGTGSMEPVIDSASLVISRRADPASLRVGDIIIFKRQGDGNDIVHRIISIREDSGDKRWFTTKGDANAELDADELSADREIYKVVAIIPIAGALVVLTCALISIVSLLALAVRIAMRINARQRERAAHSASDSVAPSSQGTTGGQALRDTTRRTVDDLGHSREAARKNGDSA